MRIHEQHFSAAKINFMLLVITEGTERQRRVLFSMHCNIIILPVFNFFKHSNWSVILMCDIRSRANCMHGKLHIRTMHSFYSVHAVHWAVQCDFLDDAKNCWHFSLI